jgi:hypothetical protein
MAEFDYRFRLVITKEQWLNEIGLALNDTEYEIFWYRTEEEDGDEEEEWIVATEGFPYVWTLLPEIMVNEKQNALEIGRMNSIHNAIKDHMNVARGEPEWKKYMGLSRQPAAINWLKKSELDILKGL